MIPGFLAGFREVDVLGTCDRIENPNAPVWSKVHLETAKARRGGTLGPRPVQPGSTEIDRLHPHGGFVVLAPLETSRDRVYVALKIDGPIPGGNLPPCAVLRCDHEGEFLATVAPDFGGSSIETLLCPDHSEAINRGKPWRWDQQQRMFLVGNDTKGDGRFTAVGGTITRNTDIDSLLSTEPVLLDLVDERGEPLRVAISGKLALRLGRDLESFGHDAENR